MRQGHALQPQHDERLEDHTLGFLTTHPSWPCQPLPKASTAINISSGITGTCCNPDAPCTRISPLPTSVSSAVKWGHHFPTIQFTKVTHDRAWLRNLQSSAPSITHY